MSSIFRGTSYQLLTNIRSGRRYTDVHLIFDKDDEAADVEPTVQSLVNELDWSNLRVFTIDHDSLWTHRPRNVSAIARALGTSTELRVLDLTGALLLPIGVMSEIATATQRNSWPNLEHFAWSTDGYRGSYTLMLSILDKLCEHGNQLKHLHIDGPVNTFSTCSLFAAIAAGRLSNLEVLFLGSGRCDLSLDTLISAIESDRVVIPKLRELTINCELDVELFEHLLEALSVPERRPALEDLYLPEIHIEAFYAHDLPGVDVMFA